MVVPDSFILLLKIKIIYAPIVWDREMSNHSDSQNMLWNTFQNNRAYGLSSNS